MIEALKAFFAKNLQPAPAGGGAPDELRPLRIAACALLLELAHADSEFGPEERIQLEDAMRRHFDLGEDAARELIGLAEAERREATDLFQFTSLINRHYDEGQRMVLAEVFWRIVYADGKLTEHEASLARRLASLLELNPGFLNEARRRAKLGG